MALQVWLPLNSDKIVNNGLAPLTFTATGTYSLEDEGILGRSYLFSGGSILSNEIPEFTNGLIECTICCWIRTSTLGWTRIGGLCSHRRTHLDIHSSGYLRLYAATNDTSTDTTNVAQSSFAITDDKWHFVAGVVTATSNQLWVDNVKVAEANHAAYTHTVARKIGIATIDSGSAYQGYMQDFRIYDEALTPKQLEELYRGLILHYPLTEDYAINALNSIYYDTSGYCHNGTMESAFTAFSPSPRYTQALYLTKGITIPATDTANLRVALNKAQFTITFWMRRPASVGTVASGVLSFGSSGTNKMLHIVHRGGNPSNGFAFAFYSNDYNSPYDIAQHYDEWIFAAFVCDTPNRSVYCNCELVGTQNFISAGTLAIPANTICRIGNYNNSNLSKEAFSDFRIYARALDLNELQDIYLTSMNIDSAGNISARVLS